jgi:prolyl oligopeptidase
MRLLPRTVVLLAVFPLMSIADPAPAAAPADPFLWLEDVQSDRSLAWAREQNAVTQRELEASPDFKPIYDRLLAIYDSKARIPYVTKHGEFYYNFWRDARHVRGIWRRTTLAEFRKESPAWETVLDLDALASSEKENWVWKRTDWLRPGYERCFIQLSRGGGDAVVVREFDVPTKSFVKADAFHVPEAKTDVAWRDRDTLYVGTDFGPGTRTDSGYPRIVKEWRRGTPLASARTVFEGVATDVSVSASVSRRFGYHREFLRRSITFFSGETHLRVGDKFVKLDVPADARVGTFKEFITVTLRSAWTVGGRTYAAGALLSAPWERFLAGSRDFEVLFQPGPRTSLASFSATRQHIILNELDNVRSRLTVLTRDGTTWRRAPLPAPELGNVSASSVDEDSDDYFLNVTGFLTPSSLYLGTLGSEKRELLKQLPSFFDATGLAVSQHEAVSKDGTRVPYFQVARADLKLDGSHPTLLYGYGGFEIAQRPNYGPANGSAWLERGGVYVLANIRGGGEFGPAWHQAALKENRQRAYDDFIAIGEDLIARRVTSTPHLGVMGGSNGGLLVGVMLTQRPDLFGAVVCQVPLLDMRRYNQLLAGASWMGEYGNPDVPAEWAYISRYSPYQNIRPGVKYPRVLFTTSTRDDRVHPGHARKMAAKLEAQKADVLYYENIEGGHGGAANNQQSAYMGALAYTFLLKQLK